MAYRSREWIDCGTLAERVNFAVNELSPTQPSPGIERHRRKAGGRDESRSRPSDSWTVLWTSWGP